MTYKERLNIMKELRRSLNDRRNNLESKIKALEKQCNDSIDDCKNSLAINEYESYMGEFEEDIHLDKALDNLDNILGELKSQIQHVQQLRDDEELKYNHLTYAMNAYQAQENLKSLRSLTGIDPEVKQTLLNRLYQNAAYKGYLNY